MGGQEEGVPRASGSAGRKVAAAMVSLLSGGASYLTGAFAAVGGRLAAGLRSSDWDVLVRPSGPWPVRRVQSGSGAERQ
jgi:hypothetical protein